MLENISGKDQGMVVSVLNIPSCLSVEQAQLELLKESKAVDNYEVSSDGSSITLYWTYLKNNEIKRVTLSRMVQFAGKCQSLPSSAFLYYADES